MAKKCFVPKAYSFKDLAKIRRANGFVDAYAAMGLKLTVRQLYYRFVADNVIPNTFRSYKNFCELIKDARLSGHVDWDGIEDRTRELTNYLMHENADAGHAHAVKQYIEDLWADQPVYCEAWIEKEALIGVLERPCWEYRLPFVACRGYTSTSEIYSAARRFREKVDEGKKPVILHLGDHDPSGKDMTRDNMDRLDLLSNEAGIELRRIALNMDQIDQYQPPSQWPKEKDSRTPGYVAEFGNQCWELDALQPDVLMEIISEGVKPLIDWAIWEKSLAREEESRVYMKDIWTRGKKARRVHDRRQARRDRNEAAGE